MKGLLLIALTAGGGGLMVMSGAHAAAFTPRPSVSAAVPAPQLGVAAPDVAQQAMTGERSFAMKLHDWLACYFGGPIYAATGGTGGAGQLARAGEKLLDIPVETRASAPDVAHQAVTGQRSFAMELHDWLATYFGGPIYVGTGSSAQFARGGEAILDLENKRGAR
jgi:hypothetical protein